MSGRHQPENGADSERALEGAKRLTEDIRNIGRAAETATTSDDRLHSAGVAPDGVASQTVTDTSSGGLDVERLARAMELAAAKARYAYGDDRVPGFGVVAKYVAAEYARLASDLRPQADPHEDIEDDPAKADGWGAS